MTEPSLKILKFFINPYGHNIGDRFKDREGEVIQVKQNFYNICF